MSNKKIPSSELDYWYLKDYYNLKQRKLISNFIEKNYEKLEPKSWQATDGNKVSVKNTKTLIIQWNKIKKIVGQLESSMNYINQKNFGYHLHPFNDFTNCLFNIYDSKTKGSYDWHVDSSRCDINDVKLTVLVNLSEEYTGGTFHIFHGHDYIVKEFNPGTVLIFKSYLNHKVSPVLSGVRKTLTLLLEGPKLR